MGQCVSRVLSEEFGPQQEAYTYASRGNVDGLKQWLEDGNDVNTPAVWLMSRELLLHRAAKNGEIECMRVLLDAGAFVDVGSEEGTPLMCAARGGHTEAVKLLLARDADACALFGGLKNASVLAAETGHAETAALLAAAVKQQARDPEAAAARLRRRAAADEAVERNMEAAAKKEHDEVEEEQRRYLARVLGLEPLLRLLLMPCGPPRSRRPVRLDTPRRAAAAAPPPA